MPVPTVKHRFERVAGSEAGLARVATVLIANGRTMHTKPTSDVIVPDEAFETLDRMNRRMPDAIDSSIRKQRSPMRFHRPVEGETLLAALTTDYG